MKKQSHNDQPDLDLFGSSGEQLRDEGIGRVLDHNQPWLEMCKVEARKFAASHSDFTGEDLRLHCRSVVGWPGHHNAWGGLTSALLRDGSIRFTGMYRKMKDPSSHARKTPVYCKA
jgi:hypothetical protein